MQTQEDRYYASKEAFSTVLGIDITLEQWNILFFKHIEPHSAEVMKLRTRLARIRKLHRDLNEAIEE